MKKFAMLVAVVAFITTVSFAQSSGNFTYGTGQDSNGNPITTA